MRRRLPVILLAAVLTIPATAAVAAPPDDDPIARFGASGVAGPVGTLFTPANLDPTQRITVVVEMTGDPVAVVAADAQRDLSDEETATVRSTLESAQQPVVSAIEGSGGSVDATMQSAYNGIQATVSAGDLAEIAALPGVVAVRPAPTYTIDNAESVPFLGVPQVWQDTGYTGQGVKVAIIDTGIDYTHADFGGPGTVAAFEAAASTSTASADPALFGPDAPRVKGGIDLVGDDYDANDPESQPQPDDNPLDCEGHGSHVAGTAAGGGVTADGESFAGPYDASTADRDWTIGPGTAPQADLYAIRVFGCTGSTNVVVPAIDWAVANGMDVINMSLGSSYGRADDPDAVAASNAVGAGVIVVASAGNSGPSPYLAGSPATGPGVISVAAVDSVATFPGAEVTVDGTVVPAINANGADLSGLGELTVVRLVDDPSTPDENEALGCSTAAYTRNGVTPGGDQLAVMQRGVCARAAKPIFAQQAGAAAALMVNTSNDYPPYEGEILANPDTGAPFTVTIPFLGVRASDGPAFTTGAMATVAAKELANPAYRGYASFSSNGPRSGDSGMAVDLAAPGVSIVSTAVGTGAEGEALSGTSMAAPHVAGIAALARQAHPDWSSADVTAALVGSADPDGVAGQQLTRGGVGLVDAAQAVATQVTATGDAFLTDEGRRRETALNLGFAEASSLFVAAKTVKVTNHGTSPVTYQVSSTPTEESLDARVSLSRDEITVRPGGTATVVLSIRRDAAGLPGSSGDDPFALHEFSGDVTLTAEGSTLRVPYLMVVRPDSRVSTNTSALFRSSSQVADGTTTLKLRNVAGAIDGTADVYTWGLSDGRDLPSGTVDTGFDVASVGVQSFPTDDGPLLVFAVNTHARWSNAAANEFDIAVDLDGDGETDATVFAVDRGLVTAGAVDGLSAVFVADAAGDVSSTGFLASAPTDSSTILIPVLAADLGWTGGALRYSALGASITTGVTDEVDGVASYDPDAPALSNGQFETVPRGATVSVPIVVDAEGVTSQQPLGVMIVAIDNESGPREALLVKTTR